MLKNLAYLQEVVNLIPGYSAVYKVDKGVQRVFYSANFPELLGYSQEEYNKSATFSTKNYIYPLDQRIIEDKILKNLGKNDKFDLSLRLVHKSGKLIWVRVHIKALGKIEGHRYYIANTFNVTNEWENMDTLLEVSDRAIAAIDKNTKVILYGNKNFFQYVGLSEEECLGKPCYSVVCKMLSWSEEKCVCFSALQDSAPLEYHEPVHDKDFTILAREAHWGEHEAIVFYLNDVTENKKKGKELAKKDAELQSVLSELVATYKRQLDSIMNISGEALSTFQINITQNTCKNGVSKYANFLNLARRGTFDSYFEDASAYMLPDEYAATVAMFSRENLIREFKAGKTTFSVDTYYLLSKDNERLIRTIINLAQNPLTHEIEGIIYAVDLTKNALNAAILEQTFIRKYEGAVLIDVPKQKYRLLQFAYKDNLPDEYQLRGYTAGLQRLVDSYVAEEERKDYLEHASLPCIVDALTKKSSYSFLANYVTQGVKRLKKITYKYVHKRSGKILATVEDITDITLQEQKRVQELRLALKEAEDARETKSMFFSNVSHDMRTPLNGVLGFTALGLEAKTLAEKDDCLDKIKMSGEFLLSLINDTLDISKIESHHMVLNYESVSLKDLVDGILSSVLQAAKGKDITLTTHINDLDTKFVRIDKMRFQQIFINLLGNAVKFTPAHGQIEFTLEALSRKYHNCNYKISVKDNGIGMKASFLPHAFEAFSQEIGTSTQKVMGTGLGLAIVKELVTLLQGEIEVKSTVGKGSEFIVYLPLTLVEGISKEAELKISDVSLQGKRVLLCEDHPINRELMLRILQKKEIEAEWAADGKIGVEKFAQSPLGYYDAILMDVRMPNMDGIEATREIRKMQRSDAQKVPIIAMTANALPEDKAKAKAEGMTDYLTKPVVLSDFNRVLKLYLT